MRFGHHSEKIDVVKKVPMFAHLSSHHLDAIARHADELDSRQGQVVVRQGELGHELIILVDATARVERDGTPIAHLKAGDIIGEMALLDGKPRSATVTIDDPGTILLIHSREFSHLLDTLPGLARSMLVTLSTRIRELQERFVD